jgi:hypothetical protein
MDEEGLPENKQIKTIHLKDSSILKQYRQKNATHVGDRESAISVSNNFDYDKIGRLKYEFKRSIAEPDFPIEKSMLVKLGQLPLPSDNKIHILEMPNYNKRNRCLEPLL